MAVAYKSQKTKKTNSSLFIMIKILVTGGEGYIGPTIIFFLLDKKYIVTIMIRIYVKVLAYFLLSLTKYSHSLNVTSELKNL